ncbi:MAG TPA: arginine decarboxylase, partial [bacterium]|nr:arginine decarboxylase [bacterium]
GGIILGQVWPIWMQPPVLDKQNIILECNVQVVEKYLQEFPEVKAVLLTSPTYNGVITDLEKIAEIVHKHGKLLIVDEAWGPHLHFLGRKLSATECGADIVINSLHKILPTFSQGSVIHVMNDDRVDLDRLRRVVSLLQTTSPFYPGLALMDWVREWMVKKGKRLTEKMFELGIHGRERLNRIPHVSAFSPEQLPEGYFFDESKLTLEISEMGYTGYQLDKILSRRGIQVDCAGYTTLIAPLGLGSRKKDIDLLVSELKNIKPKNKKISFYFWLPKFSPEMALLPNDVFFIQNRKKIPIEESVGLISAEIVSPYPPGIPVLVPGERITVEVCNYLKDLVKRKIIKKTGLEVVSL